MPYFLGLFQTSLSGVLSKRSSRGLISEVRKCIYHTWLGIQLLRTVRLLIFARDKSSKCFFVCGVEWCPRDLPVRCCTLPYLAAHFICSFIRFLLEIKVLIVSYCPIFFVVWNSKIPFLPILYSVWFYGCAISADYIWGYLLLRLRSLIIWSATI